MHWYSCPLYEDISGWCCNHLLHCTLSSIQIDDYIPTHVHMYGEMYLHLSTYSWYMYRLVVRYRYLNVYDLLWLYMSMSLSHAHTLSMSVDPPADGCCSWHLHVDETAQVPERRSVPQGARPVSIIDLWILQSWTVIIFRSIFRST